MRSYLKIFRNDKWQYVFCYNENKGVITTDHKESALDHNAFDTFTKLFGNEKFIVEVSLTKKEMNKLNEVQKKYNFKITNVLYKAIMELERLIVSEYRWKDFDTQKDFRSIWNSVQHEVDLYEENEDSPLVKRTYESTKKWLDKWEHLAEI